MLGFKKSGVAYMGITMCLLFSLMIKWPFRVLLLFCEAFVAVYFGCLFVVLGFVCSFF